jgi:Protein of unknown function (DUF995)
MRLNLRIATGLAIVCIPSAAQAADYLDKSELTTLIAGNTVYFKNFANGVTGRAFHDTSGRILVERDDGAAFEGLWSVQANGKLCMIVSNEICSTVTKNTDGSYTRRTDGGDIYQWTKITPGKGF